MDILVILALVVGALLCLTPGIMAWNHYIHGSKQAAKKSRAVRATKPATTGQVF